MAKLGLRARPRDMAWLQAAAAAGQSVLMQRAYEEAFGKVGAPGRPGAPHARRPRRPHPHQQRQERAPRAARGGRGADPQRERRRRGRGDQVRRQRPARLHGHAARASGLRARAALGRRGPPSMVRASVPVIHDVAAEALPLVRAKKSGVGTGGTGEQDGSRASGHARRRRTW